MTARPDDLVLMTGSYALDALDDDERARMDAYVESSADARAEVASLRATALLLAYAVEPVEPSSAMRSNLMAKIASTPQLAPLAPGEQGAGEHGAGDRSSREARHAAPSAPVADVVTSDSSSVVRPTASSGSAGATAQARWFRRPAAIIASAAAAIAIIVAGGLGAGALLNPADNGGAQVQASSKLDQIYAAADFRRSTTKVASGGTATVVWSNQLKRSAVIFKGVKAAPTGKTYELWYIGTTAVPAGTVDAVDGGTTTVVLKGAKAAKDTIGVTVEPAGGSSQPTTNPIVAVSTDA